MTTSQLLIAIGVGLVASIAGGAIGGIVTGGKALGNELAATMGAFYGPIGGFHGTLIALLVFYFLGQGF
ncbi:MAG: hypothetical protein KDD11_13115 [Acidobacteria bacterium]|nr:hypothetical protein [Acidobacteriota bacterium]